MRLLSRWSIYLHLLCIVLSIAKYRSFFDNYASMPASIYFYCIRLTEKLRERAFPQNISGKKDSKRWFTDSAMFEISACHDRLIIPRRKTSAIRERIADHTHGIFNDILEKWVSHFVYANPVACAHASANKQTRPGQRSSKI